MEKFKVYQIHLTDAEVDLVNAKGHDAVDKQKLKLDMSIGMRKNTAPIAKEAWDKGYYNHVSNITTDKGLEGVFEVGNIGPEENIERLAPMYSVSVSDVVENEDGEQFVCASIGWQKVA